jgi:hypothetical protein
MRRYLFPALAGIVLLLVVGLLHLPARLLPFLIDADTLRLSAVSGTLFDGRAARAMLRTPVGFLHLGEVRWQLRPLSLLRLSPTVQLRSEWGSQRGTLLAEQHGEQILLRDVDISFDAGLLRQLLPVELSGRIGLLFGELVLSPDRLLRADGRLVWQSAAWDSPRGRRGLGSYAATVTSPGDEQVNAIVTTLSGIVSAEGTLALDQQRYEVDLEVEATSGTLDAELAQALSLIASPSENGYRLRLDGEMASGR